MAAQDRDLGSHVRLEVAEAAEGGAGRRASGNPLLSATCARSASSSAPCRPQPRVRDHDDLVGAEQLLAHDQRADDVLGHEAARVADDVRVADPQPERLLDVEPGVHARQDREPR